MVGGAVDGELLAGQKAIVTGGARGIGRAIVEALVTAGADVTAVDLQRPEDADGLPGVKWALHDISSAGEADAVMEEHGSETDILVNNAGITGPIMGVHELGDDDWDRVLAVNTTGAFRMAKRVLPGMMAARSGHIINIASLAGLRGGRTGVAYTASKFAVVGLTYNIASGYGRFGVQCNAICPGRVKTAMGARPQRSEFVDWMNSRDSFHPAPADPSDVAAAALFLLSPGASFINGITLPIDNGRSAY